MRLFACLAVAIGLLFAPARAQNAFEPAATVNDQVITYYDLDQRMRLLVLNGAQPGPQLRGLAMDQLVEDTIKLNAGKERKIVPPPEALDASIQDFAAQRNLTVDQLEQALARVGATRKALEEALGAEMVWREVVRSRFSGRADPSEADIDQEIALAGTNQSVSVRLAEIGLPFSGRGEAETRALAERLSRELGAGGDFAAAARRYSGSPSAAQGGEVGWVPLSNLAGPIADALTGVEPGQVTQPIPVGGGMAILKVLERRSEEVSGTGPEARDALREQMRLRRLERFAVGYLQELRGEAVVDIR